MRSTSITLSLVFLKCSTGCSTPPISHLVIHCTSVRSFPRRTRLWYVLAQCSYGSSLKAVCSVSFTSIPCLPVSQASSLFLIRLCIAWYAVIWRDCCSITVWKTMNRSEFHHLSHTLHSSEFKSPTKWRSTFPLGVS